MDSNVALQLLLALCALMAYSAEGKSLGKVCRKSLRKLYKRQTFLDGSSVFPPNEEQGRGCFEFELNGTTIQRPALTLPTRWVYYPHPVAVYLPQNSIQVWPKEWASPVPGSFNLSQIINPTQPQPQPVVVQGRTLRPVTNFPPELGAFLRGYRIGQGGVGPRGAQLVEARPVKMIQLPRRGISELLHSAGRMLDSQKGVGFIKGPAAYTGPAPQTPRPLWLFGHAYGSKLPYNAYSKPAS